MSDDYVEDASLLDDDTLEESVNLDEENVASNTANAGAAAGGKSKSGRFRTHE